MYLVEGGGRGVERFDQILLVEVAAHEVKLFCEVLFDHFRLSQHHVLDWVNEGNIRGVSNTEGGDGEGCRG